MGVVCVGEPESGHVVITIEGMAGEETAFAYEICDQFRESARMVVRNKDLNGVDCLVVDLTQVEYIDHNALGALIGAFVWARRARVRFGVVDTPGYVRKILEITGLDKVLGTYPSIADAVSNAAF